MRLLNERGLSLVELLVSLAIILMAVAIYSQQSTQLLSLLKVQRTKIEELEKLKFLKMSIENSSIDDPLRSKLCVADSATTVCHADSQTFYTFPEE